MGAKAENYYLLFCIYFCVPGLVLQLLLLEHIPCPPTASPEDGGGNVEPVVECAARLQHLCGTRHSHSWHVCVSPAREVCTMPLGAQSHAQQHAGLSPPF